MPRKAGPRDAGGPDVLSVLRSATAADHHHVEDALALLDPDLRRDRLVDVLTRLHGFWTCAEAGLDTWADREPADAAVLDWVRRRRAHRFADDLAALGAAPEAPAGPEAVVGPDLPPVTDTDQALGRLYVLEGATLGGAVISRHLATLPTLGPGVRLGAFSPYGAATGAMWHAYRRVTRERVACGGDAGAIVATARGTFAALAAWCAPLGVAGTRAGAVREPASGPDPDGADPGVSRRRGRAAR